MDQLIETIFQKTNEMNRAVDEENIEVFDSLLDERAVLMASADALKSTDAHFKYSNTALQLLADIMVLDRLISKKLTGLLNQNKESIQQFKKNMQVSQKYQPYLKQTSGVFLDKKN